VLSLLDEFDWVGAFALGLHLVVGIHLKPICARIASNALLFITFAARVMKARFVERGCNVR
jgi:putative effector of murein hydrolase LrgA (UPF0299 family)